MSTRSVIAIPTEEGWQGRYCHFDGYPSNMYYQLLKLINRDGLDAVINKLIHQRWGWSTIDADTPSIEGVVPHAHAPYGSAAALAHSMSSEGLRGDGRFAVEPGYGIAYTALDGQSSEDEWHTHENAHLTWCEYAYVLAPGKITVYANEDGQWVEIDPVTHAA